MEGSLLLLLMVCTAGLRAQDRRTVSRGPGERLSVQCQYPAKYRENIKTWCRLNGRNRWDLIVVTPERIPPWTSSSGGTSIVDNKGTQVISVTVNNLAQQDAGAYGCAVYLPSTDRVDIMAIIDLQISKDVRSTSMKTSTTHNVPSPTVSTDTTTEVSQGYTVMDGTTNLGLSQLKIILISVGLGFLLLLTFIAALFYGTRIRRMQRTKDGGDENSRTFSTGLGTSKNVMRAEEAVGDDPSELDSQVVKYASLKLHANHSQSDATYGNIEFGRTEASNIASSTETVEYASIRL